IGDSGALLCLGVVGLCCGVGWPQPKPLPSATATAIATTSPYWIATTSPYWAEEKTSAILSKEGFAGLDCAQITLPPFPSSSCSLNPNLFLQQPQLQSQPLLLIGPKRRLVQSLSKEGFAGHNLLG
ncbi:hypothetical protein ACH5RR_017902, partial [Cinchona calisaya]